MAKTPTTAQMINQLLGETGDLQNKHLILEARVAVLEEFKGWMEEHIDVLRRRVSALEQKEPV